MTYLRAARPEDAETIAAFQVAMAEETEDKPLDFEVVHAGVAAGIDDPAKGRYFVVAESEDPDATVLGSLLVTLEWSDWRNGWFWWIQSVYVRAENRRQGLYRQLYEHVQREAREQPDVCGIRLYVETENVNAQRVYEQLGMQRCAYHMYEVLLGSGAESGERA